MLKFLDDSISIQQLEFMDRKTKLGVLNKCSEALKYGWISEEQKTLGALYADEIMSGHTANSEIRKINDKVGYGVFAALDFPPFTYIAEYIGVIKTKEEAIRDCNRYLAGYPIGQGRGCLFLIDAKPKGNISRFINHSNNPNLETVFAFQGGLIHRVIRSTKVILKGTQLTFDYGPSYWIKWGGEQIL